jgi:3'(2'), 5'-bisphosphate nucleotidase
MDKKENFMFEIELKIGQDAVIKAMKLSRQIQSVLSSADSITKQDKSPVTIADFASQAVICRMLNDSNSDIPIVGEEDSRSLQSPGNELIVGNILNFLEKNEEINRIVNKNNLMSSIDLGDQEPARLFWTLDPIDGTKGFLRGDQFSIALALIRNGQVVMGILGCPKLSFSKDPSKEGYLLYAVRGGGTQVLNLSTNEVSTARVSTNLNFEDMKFVQSYESRHGNLGKQGKIAKALNIKKDPIQIDSQVKYGIVSMGMAEIYLRIPHPETRGYKEKIWDHAAGSILVEEAGGVVTDIQGKRLDFSCGKKLAKNTGVLVTLPEIKDKILNLLKN